MPAILAYGYDNAASPDPARPPRRVAALLGGACSAAQATGWWLYLGGVLALVVTGANLVTVQSIGVLRTGLAALAGQITGGLVLDTTVPGSVRPSALLFLGATLTMVAALTAGRGRRER